MKQAVFLSNLLLLSPRGNFDMKDAMNKLKIIAQYIYRKILLNEEESRFNTEAEFCLSVLHGFISDANLSQ